MTDTLDIISIYGTMRIRLTDHVVKGTFMKRLRMLIAVAAISLVAVLPVAVSAGRGVTLDENGCFKHPRGHTVCVQV